MTCIYLHSYRNAMFVFRRSRLEGYRKISKLMLKCQVSQSRDLLDQQRGQSGGADCWGGIHRQMLSWTAFLLSYNPTIFSLSLLRLKARQTRLATRNSPVSLCVLFFVLSVSIILLSLSLSKITPYYSLSPPLRPVSISLQWSVPPSSPSIFLSLSLAVALSLCLAFSASSPFSLSFSLYCRLFHLTFICVALIFFYVPISLYIYLSVIQLNGFVGMVNIAFISKKCKRISNVYPLRLLDYMEVWTLWQLKYTSKLKK